MSFRQQANIDPNQHKGLILSNSITNAPLVATGLSLTNAQPLHVAIVDTSGSQVVPTSGTGTGNVNLIEVGGANISLGQTTMSSSLPITIASDQSSFPVSQSGTWNIGTVATITNALPAGSNVIGHVITDSGSTTAITGTVAATQSGNWTSRTVGNGGAVLDAVKTAATAPANGLLTLGIYNSTEPSPTTGQSVGVQLDSKGRTRQVIMDAAGNTRGVNVNASNQLSVSVDNTATISGTVTANAGTNLNTSLLALESGGNLATLAGTVSSSKVNVNISSGSIANTSFAVTQATASSLNATVVGTGTFAVQAAATLSAETTKVIGVVRNADGSGNLLTSTSNALDVNLKGNPLVSVPLVGQSKIAVSGTAVNLNGGSSQPLTNGIIITAPAGNTAPIAVGGSGVNNTSGGTGNGYQLAAGASISFAVANTNDVWINGTSGDYVSWAGS